MAIVETEISVGVVVIFVAIVSFVSLDLVVKALAQELSEEVTVGTTARMTAHVPVPVQETVALT